MNIKPIVALIFGATVSTAALAGGNCWNKAKAYYGHPMHHPNMTMKYHGKPAYYMPGYPGMNVYHGERPGYAETKNPASKGYGYSQPASTTESGDVVDTAVSAGSFSTLITALQAAGLEEALRGEGPITVFAPSDEAFAKLPEGTLDGLLANKDQLEKVLKYHVVPGRIMASDLITREEVETVEGSAIPAGDISVSKADVVASNGVIHVVDDVLIPKM